MPVRFNRVPKVPSRVGGKRLTGDERAFIVELRGRGLSSTEAARMFFRRFGRDVSVSTVRGLTEGV